MNPSAEHRPTNALNRSACWLRTELSWQQKLGTKIKEGFMYTILLVVLILMLLGALPTWPYSRSWGYYPSGGVGLIVVIVLVLLLAGRL
jgi:hypothetical protein